jgi:hypothetical protein
MTTPAVPCRCAVCTAGDGELDLTARSDADRTVAAACVRRAILRPAGLQVVGAKIDGLLQLDYTNPTGPVRLRGCEAGGISASNATFGNVVALSGSVFGGNLDFIGATFQRVLLIDSVQAADVRLWSARLLSGVSATKLVVGGDLNALELSVAASANFEDAQVAGEISFRRAHVGQTLSLKGAKCSGGINLNGAVITDVVLDVEFCKGDVLLRGIHVAETLRVHRGSFEGAIAFDECEVRDIEIGPLPVLAGAPPAVAPAVLVLPGEVTFHGGSVTTLMTIANVTFARDVRFDGFHMVGLELAGSTFEGALMLADVRIDRSANVTDCTFQGGFTAENLQIEGTTKFTDLRCDHHAVAMTGAKFGSDLRFRNVRCGRLDLSGATVGARLRFEAQGDADRALVGPGGADTFKLENVTVAQDLYLGVPVQGDVELRGLSVQGSLELAEGFRVEPAAGAAPVVVQASFLSVGRDLTFSENANVAGELDLTGAKIAGMLAFRTEAAPLPPTITLNGATLGTLSFAGGDPTDQPRIEMVGCTYDTFRGKPPWLIERFGTKQVALRAPLVWLCRLLGLKTTHDVPDRQPFLKLEAALRTAGDDALANWIFFEGRKRTIWKSSAIQWMPQYFFSGFGVRPWYLLIWIFALWFVATVFFWTAAGSVRDLSYGTRLAAAKKLDPNAKTPQSVDDRQHSCGNDQIDQFRAGLLSLELFVPATFPNTDVVATPSCPVTFGPRTIGAVTIGPQKIQPWITAVVLFALKLGGLILIPLAVVTISGVLRPSPRG